MERKVGTISRGIRCPIIREGDNLADIVVNSVLEAAESEGFELRDRDGRFICGNHLSVHIRVPDLAGGEKNSQEKRQQVY